MKSSTKKNPVIAIGLDAADPQILEHWMAQGHLKTLSKLREKGVYSRLNNTVPYCGNPTPTSTTEKLWVMFLTGCLPYKTQFWDIIKFQPDRYDIQFDSINGGYDYQEYPPFYALGEDYRVAAFDPPVGAFSDQVNGLQILGWGGHFPFTPSASQPVELLPEVILKYGKNPVLHKDHGYWWKEKYNQWLETAVHDSVTARAKICQDLLQREDWDLFLTVFGDTHSAGHGFYHMSHPDHPLYPQWHEQGRDPMLAAFETVDQAIADILSAAPENANVVCFAVHGMAINYTDLFSMTFLPELLYRWNFPGKTALPPHQSGANATIPPIISHPMRNTWSGELWSMIYDENPLRRLVRRWLPGRFLHSVRQPGVISPFELNEKDHPISWIPAIWFSPLWPQMKAFALPAFSDGLIRINLKGREANGLVAPSEYDACCNELADLARSMTDARTGRPLVKDVVRTRRSPLEDAPNLPDADLVVVWNEKPTDVIDTQMGRMGPVPYSRPGGHREQGFMVMSGPDIDPGADLADNPKSIDLAPTILSLMDAPVPDYMDGKSLLNPKVLQPN
jgi:predicted AlkP superfamily phosphohydrolase/phosphomutase